MEQADTKQEREYPPKLTAFGKWVSAQTRRLAMGGPDESGIMRTGYLRNDPYSVAAIARLRHAVGHEIGDDPETFVWTLPATDDPDISGNASRHIDEPTPQERAAHAAITLFAAHQQSIRESSMHTDDNVSLGRAVGRMAYGNFNENGIRALFGRIQTASSWKELLRHARGLIGLLKRERIALNYGLLAQDLMGLRSDRTRANMVRIRWGRDFQRAYRQEQTGEPHMA